MNISCAVNVDIYYLLNKQFGLQLESHHFSSSFDHNLHCLKKDNLCLKLGNSYPLPPGVKSIHLRPVATPCAVFIKICLISIFWREIARSLSFWHAVPVLEGERGWNNALWLLLLPLMSITSILRQKHLILAPSCLIVGILYTAWDITRQQGVELVCKPIRSH